MIGFSGGHRLPLPAALYPQPSLWFQTPTELPHSCRFCGTALACDACAMGSSPERAADASQFKTRTGLSRAFRDRARPYAAADRRARKRRPLKCGVKNSPVPFDGSSERGLEPADSGDVKRTNSCEGGLRWSMQPTTTAGDGVQIFAAGDNCCAVARQPAREGNRDGRRERRAARIDPDVASPYSYPRPCPYDGGRQHWLLVRQLKRYQSRTPAFFRRVPKRRSLIAPKVRYAVIIFVSEAGAIADQDLQRSRVGSNDHNQPAELSPHRQRVTEVAITARPRHLVAAAPL